MTQKKGYVGGGARIHFSDGGLIRDGVGFGGWTKFAALFVKNRHHSFSNSAIRPRFG